MEFWHSSSASSMGKSNPRKTRYAYMSTCKQHIPTASKQGGSSVAIVSMPSRSELQAINNPWPEREAPPIHVLVPTAATIGRPTRKTSRLEGEIEDMMI